MVFAGLKICDFDIVFDINISFIYNFDIIEHFEGVIKI